MLKTDLILSYYNFEYILTVDYDSSYQNGRCECGDDYCRCQVINE